MAPVSLPRDAKAGATSSDSKNPVYMPVGGVDVATDGGKRSTDS